MDYDMTTNRASNGFVTASLTLGIISLVTSFLCCWIFYLPLAFSSLAILFSRLSVQGTEPMHPNAKVGYVTGIISLCIVVLLIVTMFAVVLLDPSFLESLPAEYPGYEFL